MPSLLNTRRLARFITPVASLIAAITLHAQRGSEATWDQTAVTGYFDARMDLWWQRAKTLRTGTSETKCLSCHTAVPYAMVMPVLRRARGIDALTRHEQQILDMARARSAYAETDQPYYDQSEDKIRESRGVEAVVNAFVLTTYDAGPSPAPETRAAIVRLWQVQRADGAWDWLNFGLEPYEAPDAVFQGAALAALSAGSRAGRAASADAPGQAGLTRLAVYLTQHFQSQRLFNRTWALLASSRLDGVLTGEQRRALLDELRMQQHSDGGWSMADLGPWRWSAQTTPYAPPGATDTALLTQSDGFATGLVVYAMRRSGVSVDDAAVSRGQAWLRGHQTTESHDAAWAPWRAHSLNFDREHGGAKGEPWRRNFMSDLATAFATLALLYCQKYGHWPRQRAIGSNAVRTGGDEHSHHRRRHAN